MRRDYAEAARWYRKAAEQGHATAQVDLGFMYYEGIGVPLDYGEALKWYRRAAEQGNAKAQNGLGLAYYRGHGVPQDYAEAVRWYRIAAEQGDATSQNDLGLMYYNGQGVPTDYAQAAGWFRRAAEQGYTRGEYDLGLMYDDGKGVPRNGLEAKKWYVKAARHGNASAQNVLQSRARVSRMFRYSLLLLGFLASVRFSIGFLLPGRSLRSRSQRLLTFFGLIGVLYTGLSWYGESHYTDYSDFAIVFSEIRGLLLGMLIILVLLVLPTKTSDKRA